MSETVVNAEQVNTESTSIPMIVYILYMIGLLLGLTGIIGVVMAYIYKSDAPDWLKTHYQFQIRTFWIGFLYLLVGSLLSVLVIGYFVLLFWVVWLCVRCIKGIKQLNASSPIDDPKSWMF